MDHNELPIEFDIVTPGLPDQMKQEVENRLQSLAKGHTDLIGASVTLDQPVHRETGFLYQARIVVYMRPENLYASEKLETGEGALKGALDAIERQVRERRDKLGEPWKRPDLSD
jgi:ribosome-associated translation inhibitor RaiA